MNLKRRNTEDVPRVMQWALYQLPKGHEYVKPYYLNVINPRRDAKRLEPLSSRE